MRSAIFNVTRAFRERGLGAYPPRREYSLAASHQAWPYHVARFDLALKILDEGCAHDVAHDIHQSATHVEQAIDPLRFFT